MNTVSLILLYVVCEGTAGFPAVAGHALSTVIGCKLGLAASAVVPAGEFLIGVASMFCPTFPRTPHS